MDLDRLAHECNDLPIFPLGGAVLLPGAVLPLHVFEERYRRMLSDVVAGTGLMGIATVTESEGQPTPVHPVMGIGMVVAHQLLPDGRSDILVQYVGTLRVSEEHPTMGLPYRRVQGCLMNLDAGSPTAEQIASLRHLLWQLATASEVASEEVTKLTDLRGEAFVDGLARRVLPGVTQRLCYLEASSWSERTRLLEDALATYVLALLPTAGDG